MVFQTKGKKKHLARYGKWKSILSQHIEVLKISGKYEVFQQMNVRIVILKVGTLKIFIWSGNK